MYFDRLPLPKTVVWDGPSGIRLLKESKIAGGKIAHGQFPSNLLIVNKEVYWVPTRRLVFDGDSGLAVLDLLHSVRRYCVVVVSRLRLDANLYEPPPRTLGRPAAKGEPPSKLKTIAEDTTTVWRRTTTSEWYGDDRHEPDLASGTGFWYRPGSRIVPLRWVLVRSPSCARPIQAFLGTDANLSPEYILVFVVRC